MNFDGMNRPFREMTRVGMIVVGAMRPVMSQWYDARPFDHVSRSAGASYVGDEYDCTGYMAEATTDAASDA